MRDGKRDEASEAMLAEALAEFEATLNKILDRQRDLEERQRTLEQQTAAALSSPRGNRCP